MNWRERIVADPKVLVGKPVIRDTRISVELVLDLLGRGYRMEDVHRNLARTLQVVAHRALDHTELARNGSGGHVLLGQDSDRHDFLGAKAARHPPVLTGTRPAGKSGGWAASGQRGCAKVRVP